MRNRAKCKLCSDIIESFYADDYAPCKCGEIYVDGGIAMRCGSNLWENFLRLDDEGNEIIPKIQDKDTLTNNKPRIDENSYHKIRKKEMIEMLDEMRKNMENFPMNAMLTPVTHSDLCSILILLSGIFKADD